MSINVKIAYFHQEHLIKNLSMFMLVLGCVVPDGQVVWADV